MLSRTLPLLVLAALAACSTAQAPADAPLRPPDDPLTRARAAGLAEAQARALLALDAPVLLPRAMPGWTVTEARAESGIPGVVDYTVGWKREDGACVRLLGTNDGIGGPEYPGLSAEVSLAALPGPPPARVYKAGTDPGSESAQNWGAGTVISDYVEIGKEGGWMAVWLYSSSDDGCTPLGLREAASLLASLQFLDPSRPEAGFAVGDLGVFAHSDDAPPALLSVPDPLAAIQDHVQNAEAARIQVHALQQTGDDRPILATMEGTYDDSITAERRVYVYRRESTGWRLARTGWQVRCAEGRGHTDWSAAPCQ